MKTSIKAIPIYLLVLSDTGIPFRVGIRTRRLRRKLTYSLFILPFLLGFGREVLAIDITRAEALDALSSNAIAKKLNSGAAERLSKTETNDVIVEYVSRDPGIIPPPRVSAAIREMRLEYSNKKSEVKKSLPTNDIVILKDYDVLPMAFVRVNSRTALVDLLSHPGVKAIYEQEMLHYELAESGPLIHQPSTVSRGFTGAGTTVAILDTGVDYTLAEFGSCTAPGRPAGCRVVVSRDQATDDRDLDDNGHGTNVAGIVAGIAPQTQIVAIDVFPTTNNDVPNQNLIDAVNWVIANRASFNFVAVNMSLGDGTSNAKPCDTDASCPPTPTGSTNCERWPKTPLRNLRAANIIPVVSSGNNGFTNGVSSPACSQYAVAVGAAYDSNIGSTSFSKVPCTDSSTAADQVTCFSNSVNSPDLLLAPGCRITAAGSNMCGTSQAAPHVTAAIAILAAPNAYGNTAAALDNLRLSGRPVTDPRNNVTSRRIDVLEALFFSDSLIPREGSWMPAIRQPLLDD